MEQSHSADDDRLTKKVFMYDYNRCRNNWCSDIQDFFISIEKGNNFQQREAIDIDDANSTLKSKAKDMWSDSVARKPKLRTYIKFKCSFESENYVKYCNNRKDRSLMAQLRLGILPLKLETGRFKNVPVNERLCENCTDSVEDKEHFLLHCALYRNRREQLFIEAINVNNNFYNISDQEKIKLLLRDLWKQTCAFVRDAWYIRVNTVYMNRYLDR